MGREFPLRKTRVQVLENLRGIRPHRNYFQPGLRTICGEHSQGRIELDVLKRGKPTEMWGCSVHAQAEQRSCITRPLQGAQLDTATNSSVSRAPPPPRHERGEGQGALALN